MQKQGEFYIYSFNDPRTNLPYYIGKGKNQRWYDHFKDHYFRNPKNPYKARKIKKLQSLGYEPEKHVKFLGANLSEELAYELEDLVVSEIGLENLTNITPGGVGVFNRGPLPDNMKNKMSEAFKGERAPKAKLNEQQAGEIKWLAKFSGWNGQEISNIVGQVSPESVRDIKNSHSWKHVEPQKPDWFDGPLKYNGYKSEAEMIEAMRARYSEGATLQQIGKEFNVTFPTVKYKAFPNQRLRYYPAKKLTEREAGEIKWLARHSALYRSKIATMYSTKERTVRSLARGDSRKNVVEQKPDNFNGILRYRGFNNAEEKMQAIRQDISKGLSEAKTMKKYNFGHQKLKNILKENLGNTK
jgi:DNA-binding CsgD family transcriptional regulator